MPPFDGNGVYGAPGNSWNPAVVDTEISETDWATLLADLVAGLTKAVCKDGQSTATAVIPFAQGISLSGGTNLTRYNENTWTPVLTCATPGNLTVAYTTQTGKYTRIGRLVTVEFTIVTSTFTHTTASGDLQITGLPFAPAANTGYGSMSWQGITKANFTQMVPRAITTSLLNVLACGSAQSQANVQITEMPTTGTVVLSGSISYMV